MQSCTAVPQSFCERTVVDMQIEFRPIGDTGVYYLMEWVPPGVTPTPPLSQA